MNKENGLLKVIFAHPLYLMLLVKGSARTIRGMALANNLFDIVNVFYFHVLHIASHKYPRLIFMFDLLYMPIAHQVLPVSLVDSITARVGDEQIYLAYIIYI